MTGLEVVVGFLVAWVVRKGRRVGARVDAEVDQALDAGLDRLQQVVAGKLARDPSLERLRAEAEDSGEVGTRTQARVRLALEEAVDQDPEFASSLQAAVQQVRVAQDRAGAVAGDHGSAVAGDVDIHADRGSAAAWQMGNVTLGGEWPGPR